MLKTLRMQDILYFVVNLKLKTPSYRFVIWNVGEIFYFHMRIMFASDVSKYSETCFLEAEPKLEW